MVKYTVICLGLWILSQCIIRLLGHLIFNLNSPLLYILIFITIPLVYLVTYTLYDRLHITNVTQTILAGRMFPTFLLLEIPLFIYWESIFPNMTANAMILYAAYLFAFYALCLLTGTINDPIKRNSRIEKTHE